MLIRTDQNVFISLFLLFSFFGGKIDKAFGNIIYMLSIREVGNYVIVIKIKIFNESK